MLVSDIINEDRILARAIKSGGKSAFALVYKKYHNQLYFSALSYFKDPCQAEDVVQDIFIKLWTFRENLKENLSLKSFLHTSMRNLILNTIRNNNTKLAKHTQILQWSESGRNYVEETLILEEYEKIIEGGISQLSPAKQNIFRLRTRSGLNNKEISEQLGLSINTVKFQFSNASRFMRGYLREKAGI